MPAVLFEGVHGERGHDLLYLVAERLKGREIGESVAGFACDQDIAVARVRRLDGVDVVVHRVAEGEHRKEHRRGKRDDEHGAYRA